MAFNDLDRKRIENAIGIIGLRVRPNGMDVMPQASSVALTKMILLDAASLLDHFMAVDNSDG
jgi:hypothetical protein